MSEWRCWCGEPVNEVGECMDPTQVALRAHIREKLAAAIDDPFDVPVFHGRDPGWAWRVQVDRADAQTPSKQGETDG